MVEANTVFQLLGPLAESAREVRYRRGQQIFYRTDPINDVYCVADGLVREFIPGDDARKHRIEDLEPYSLLNVGLNISLEGVDHLHVNPFHHFSAVAVRKSILLVVSAQDIEQQFRSDPDFRIKWLMRIAGKQRLAYERVPKAILNSLHRGRQRIKPKALIP